ncbi:MAG TPA: glycosyltransferase family 39 protein [Hyphomicrobiaceae bacterium]|nr:glycosyltransferase family 39 protein [Hyphomicrobiaceae bacterium]
MPAQPAWATPRSVALIIAAYLLAHLGVRLWIGPALGVDDAEQALFAQHWLPSYRLRAPPLFTWALVALSPITGVGMVVISLLRTILLAMVLGFTYLTAHRLIRDPVLAALAAFSITAIYVFGYYSHHDLTHTTVLSAFLAASWYVLVRLTETPRLPWYLALGLCFGLGTLGKWNFAIFALALPLACLVTPGYRHLVLNWRIVPAALLAAAIVLPSALWALHVGPAAGDGMGNVLGDRAGTLPLVLVKGTASLALAVLAYPLPFLVIFLLAFGPIAWRGLRVPATSAPGADPFAPTCGYLPSDAKRGLTPAVPSTGLLAMVMIIGIALHWLLVPLTRATHFAERLMQPALMLLPVYLFMLVEGGLKGGPAPARHVRNYTIALAAVAGVALLARIGIHAAGPDVCRTACRDLLPVVHLAAGLRQAGFNGKGTVVVRDVHLGGNLRVQLPEARFVATGYPARMWPRPAPESADTSRSGQCLAVWSDYKGGAERQYAEIRAYLARELGVPAEAKGRRGEVAARYAGSKRTARVLYELFDTPQGDCR